VTVSYVWHLAPHDPLVLGTGRRLPATLPRMTHAMPLPATLAGAVRARFVGGAIDVTPEAAQTLLDTITVRGPWLQRGDTVMVRAPLHVREHARAVVYPTLDTLKQGEGVFLPEGTPELGALAWEAPAHAHKLAPLDEFVSLDDACKLLCGELPSLGDALSPVVFEGRVHVTINPASQTAEDAALYSTSGVRYRDDVTIGVEVTAQHEPAEGPEKLFVLGGETRIVARREGSGFPDFDLVRARYENALRAHGDQEPLLMLMLATPASYSTLESDVGLGWVPPWLLKDGRVAGLDDVRFSLAAVATERFVPVSGWSLASRPNGAVQGVQRAVRRLVPAGTVYMLRARGGADPYLRACERFWGRSIDETSPGNPGALLAAPHRDGYGMVLPGLWWPETPRGNR
jgi:CRISPR type III-B/RAMP module-associated protein Cmr3